jgi:hypothetical protein
MVSQEKEDNVRWSMHVGEMVELHVWQSGWREHKRIEGARMGRKVEKVDEDSTDGGLIGHISS